MKSRWFIIAVLFPVLSFSQESSTKSRFHIIASAGIVAGESAAKPLVQAIPGLAHGKSFAGVGAGLDYYALKSIPLFIDYRWMFAKNGSAFLYADAGYNLPFGNKSEFYGSYISIDRYYGGCYLDAGIGYRAPINSHHHLL